MAMVDASAKRRMRLAGVAAAGFSMIEVLVTLLIISLALLGTAGLQAYAMRMNQGGQFRSQAVLMASDLAERMEANKAAAIAGSYVVAQSSTPATASAACTSSACAAMALAAYDLAQWQSAVAATLPQGSWSVTQVATGNPTTYRITIGWVDRKADTTQAAYDEDTGMGSNAAGTGERFFYTSTRTIFN